MSDNKKNEILSITVVMELKPLMVTVLNLAGLEILNRPQPDDIQKGTNTLGLIGANKRQLWS